MKFLLVCKQERNVATFLDTIRCLVRDGHAVTLGVQERDDDRDARLAAAVDSPRFRVVRCPPDRTDDWAPVAPLVRRLRDSAHYLQGPMRGATKLQGRVLEKLHRELELPGEGEAAFLDALRGAPEATIARLDDVIRLAERSLPSAPLFDELIASESPDVLLVTPLVHFGSAQADLVASARRLQVPVWMLLFSWDNLSTKGCLHRVPDRMFVWNTRQRDEAWQLHRYPPERVVVVGAPRFDDFFALTPRLSRAEFHGPLGLDPERPTLLYVCSSPLVADREFGFIRRWIQAVRSGGEPLAGCNILVRPHPDIEILPDSARYERLVWPQLPQLTARVARPFDDARALVLRTERHMPQGLYESIWQSHAVVGLNTSAELEAGIVGRPVFTILADGEEADGQSGTLHFHYLTREHGGFVSTAATLDGHVRQLEAALRDGVDPAPIRTFIQEFLRPHGLDRPVGPLLAGQLVRAADTAAAPAETAETPAPDDQVDPGAPHDAGDVVPLRFEPSRLVVHARGEAARRVRKGGVKVDGDVVAWLMAQVAIGDVLYDIGAEFGTYTLIAARHRGALVVAFEGAYASYANLCDNLLLNECEGTVVPVPMAVSSRDVLGEIRYPLASPGEGRYQLRQDPWRSQPSGRTKPYGQPSCLARLDTLVERWGLPKPQHLRIAQRMPAADVLRGAAATLASPSLRSLLLHIPAATRQTVIEPLTGLGWTVVSESPDHDDIKVSLARTVAPPPASGVTR